MALVKPHKTLPTLHQFEVNFSTELSSDLLQSLGGLQAFFELNGYSKCHNRQSYLIIASTLLLQVRRPPRGLRDEIWLQTFEC
jgi:hypothetical protein